MWLLILGVGCGEGEGGKGGGDLDRDGWEAGEGDCDDLDAEVYPGAAEIPYSGRDEDCEAGTADDDLDGDGYAVVEDCDDLDAGVNPDGTEVVYNGVDEDCDGWTADDDLDGDGWGAGEGGEGERDCDDADAGRSPGTAEVYYDGVDQDCDPLTADGDQDGDGYAVAEDCDDLDAAAWMTGAWEGDLAAGDAAWTGFCDGYCSRSVSGRLDVSAATMESLAAVGCVAETGELDVQGSGLTGLSGLARLAAVSGTAQIRDNPLLVTLGLSGLVTVGRDLAITGNAALCAAEADALYAQLTFIGGVYAQGQNLECF